MVCGGEASEGKTNTIQPQNRDLKYRYKTPWTSIYKEAEIEIISEFTISIKAVIMVSVLLEPNSAFMDAESDGASDEL